MGQITQFFQPPLYWQQFEDLTQAIVKEIYGLPHASMIGRPGQAQNGVDVHGCSDKFGDIGVQCKRLDERDENNNPLPGGVVTTDFLEKEASKALSFNPKLKLWILATTAKRDAKAQESARTLGQRYKDQGNFEIIVWFWDDFVSWLNAFPSVQRWYYDQVIQVSGRYDQDKIILETIASAFDRPAFSDPLDQEHVDDFKQALKDTQLALRTGELLERRTRHVIRKAIGGWRLIETAAWRHTLEGINKELQVISGYLSAGLKDGRLRTENGYLEVFDHQLGTVMDAGRRRCMDMLNHILIDAGLRPL